MKIPIIAILGDAVQRQISSRFFVFEKEVAAVSPSRYS
jgi:hypothetical protein